MGMKELAGLLDVLLSGSFSENSFAWCHWLATICEGWLKRLEPHTFLIILHILYKQRIFLDISSDSDAKFTNFPQVCTVV